MSITSVSTPTGLYYQASIKQRGVSVSIICQSRKEALTRCWHEFCMAIKG